MQVFKILDFERATLNFLNWGVPRGRMPILKNLDLEGGGGNFGTVDLKSIFSWGFAPTRVLGKSYLG